MVGRCRSVKTHSQLAWSTPMRSVAIMLVIALGLTAGAVTAALADRVPADLWERLDRERF